LQELKAELGREQERHTAALMVQLRGVTAELAEEVRTPSLDCADDV